MIKLQNDDIPAIHIFIIIMSQMLFVEVPVRELTVLFLSPIVNTNIVFTIFCPSFKAGKIVVNKIAIFK